MTLLHRIFRPLASVLCLAACGGGAVSAAAASETTDSAFMRTLKDVEVTATRRPLATTQVLAGPKLQALSSTSVADALKYFAGVQIKDYGGLGGLKTINVRSLGSQHVGVYIDGIRITNAQNGTVDLGKFSLSTLESVSLYNANRLDMCQSASEYASGATVYLQTRRPVSDSLTVLAGVGSFHTYRGRANMQFSRRGWSGFVDGEYLNSQGDYPFRYKSEFEDTVGRRRNSDIEYFRIESALFRGGFASHVYCYVSERGCPGGSVRLSGPVQNQRLGQRRLCVGGGGGNRQQYLLQLPDPEPPEQCHPGGGCRHAAGLCRKIYGLNPNPFLSCAYDRDEKGKPLS